MVVYFLSRKMTVVDRSIVEENKTTTWHSEPLSFARSERRCVRLIQHQCDDSFVKKGILG